MMNRKKSIIILCDSNRDVGLGHYSRSLALKNLIQKNFKKIKVSIIVISNEKKFFKKAEIISNSKLTKKVNHILNTKLPTHCFFNLSPDFEKKKFKNFFKLFINKKIKLIAIDNLFNYHKFLDHIWVPNIYLNPKLKKNIKFSFGFNKLLINKKKNIHLKKDNSILIITGGTDKYNLSKKIPPLLEKHCLQNTNISWVIGPYAKKPILKNTKLRWNFYNKPRDLSKIYKKSSVAFVLFGISFFEIVNYSIPCSIYSPKFKETRALEKEIKKKFFIDNNLENVIIDLISKFKNLKIENSRAIRLSKLINLKKRDSFIKKLI